MRRFALLALLSVLVPGPAAAQIDVAVQYNPGSNLPFAAVVAQLNDNTQGFGFNAVAVPTSGLDTLAELNAFDVVVVGDSGHSDHGWTLAMANAMNAFLQGGGGFVGSGWIDYHLNSSGDPVDVALAASLPMPTIPGNSGYCSGVQQVVTIPGHAITDGVGSFSLPTSTWVETTLSNPNVTNGQVHGNVTSSCSQGGLHNVVVSGEIGSGRTVYVGVLYTGATSTYTNGDVRTGSADRLFEQAVAWAAGGAVNTPPVADAGGAYTGAEGSPIALDGSASTDPDGVVSTWSWDCETDGVFDVTSSAATGDTCTYADEGTYVVTLEVTDDDGDTATATTTATITNVAPTIDSVAPTSATENSTYTYTPTAVDPGTADVLTWSLTTAPAGMALGPTGAITWTPSYAAVGVHAATLEVSDGDGGADTQSWQVTVAFQDDDVDGMPDTWEGSYGLDPTDPTDATADPDADGISNLDEFLGGTDPTVFDGPDAPVPIAPVAGEEVDTLTPGLLWVDSIDPQGDVLTYEVEVYADATAQVLLTSAAGIPSGGAGSTTWTLDVPAPENSDPAWRVRAADVNVSGPWSALEPFFVNEVNEPPAVPAASYPLDGALVADLAPGLSWTPSVDVDRDAVTYDVQVFAEDGVTLVTSVAGVAPSGGLGEGWIVAPDLEEDVSYAWVARAVDEHGLASEWSEPEPFLVSTANGAPDTPVWIAPEDGAQVESTQPTMVVTAVTDPEGAEVSYLFRADVVDTLDSPDVEFATVLGGDETASWAPELDGVEFPENTWMFAQVQAMDPDGAGSPPALITFFVRGENDPPPVPVLLSPDDGTETASATGVFVAAHVEDPELDAVSYDFVIAEDEALADVVDEGPGVPAGGGPEGAETQASWQSGETLEAGTYYWSARAVDAFGAASDWASPFELQVLPRLSDESGCTCRTSLAPAPPSAGWLLLALIAVRRRR